MFDHRVRLSHRRTVSIWKVGMAPVEELSVMPKRPFGTGVGAWVQGAAAFGAGAECAAAGAGVVECAEPLSETTHSRMNASEATAPRVLPAAWAGCHGGRGGGRFLCHGHRRKGASRSVSVSVSVSVSGMEAATQKRYSSDN